eukprot:7659823-Pyramimonas_sp.AAC.1
MRCDSREPQLSSLALRWPRSRSQMATFPEPRDTGHPKGYAPPNVRSAGALSRRFGFPRPRK